MCIDMCMLYVYHKWIKRTGVVCTSVLAALYNNLDALTPEEVGERGVRPSTLDPQP